MLRLADVLRRHAPAYIERHGSRMMPGHLRAVQAILRCRTPAMGGHLAACAQCGHEHLVYHSCRHRACPQCGHDATTRWLERQRDLLLAAPYFHVVFTLPAELRRLVRSHQKALLPALFRAAFESLAELCADARFLGAQIGALAVLHTWTRTLEWHPHVHLLVPAGGLAPDGRTWLAVPRRRQRFLVPVRALAKRFRGRFLHLARQASPDVVFPVIPWGKSWVVFAKPTVQGADQVLEYLGRYVHKTAIADGALLACDDRTVTFRYRDSRDHRSRVMTLDADELLRRFLQHVLPKGMHRVRAFGLLHPAHRGTLRRLQLLLAQPVRAESEPAERRARSRRRCPGCGAPSPRLGRRLSPAECAAFAGAAIGAPADRARAPP
jgi:hypothetical protein